MPTDAAEGEAPTASPVEVQVILMRAEARNATAQAVKAEKEARWYPWVAIGISLLGSAGLIGAPNLLATFLVRR